MGELRFTQDGQDLIIKGVFMLTAGRFVVRTEVDRIDPNNIILKYREVYNEDYVAKSPALAEATWVLKNTTRGKEKYTVKKLAPIFLTLEELKELLFGKTQTDERSENKEQ